MRGKCQGKPRGLDGSLLAGPGHVNMSPAVLSCCHHLQTEGKMQPRREAAVGKSEECLNTLHARQKEAIQV